MATDKNVIKLTGDTTITIESASAVDGKTPATKPDDKKPASTTDKTVTSTASPKSSLGTISTKTDSTEAKKSASTPAKPVTSTASPKSSSGATSTKTDSAVDGKTPAVKPDEKKPTSTPAKPVTSKTPSELVEATATSKDGRLFVISATETKMLEYAKLIKKTKDSFTAFKKGKITDKSIESLRKELANCLEQMKSVDTDKKSSKVTINKEIEAVYVKANKDLDTMVDDFNKITIKHNTTIESEKKSNKEPKKKHSVKRIVALAVIAATLVGASVGGHFIGSNHHKKAEEKARITSMEEGYGDNYKELLKLISTKSGVYIDEINNVVTDSDSVAITGSCGSDVAVVTAECAKDLVEGVKDAEDKLLEKDDIETKTAFINALMDAVNGATDVTATTFNKASINTFDMKLSGKKVLDYTLSKTHNAGMIEDVEDIVTAMDTSKITSNIKVAYGVYEGKLIVVANVDENCVTFERDTNGAAVTADAVEKLFYNTVVDGKEQLNFTGYNSGKGVQAATRAMGVTGTTDFVEASAGVLVDQGLAK